MVVPPRVCCVWSVHHRGTGLIVTVVLVIVGFLIVTAVLDLGLAVSVAALGRVSYDCGSSDEHVGTG